jgi:hypothetical protein
MTTFSGGCQCGAIRYRICGALTNAHLCHCRMCQKAAGNYFMTLANVQRPDFTVTRGEIAWFASSAAARRGFCRDCGTPLVYDGLDSPHINITLGSLDNPAAVEPEIQVGVESKMPWFSRLDSLEAWRTEDGFDPAALARIETTQRVHPDRDTKEWPPR